MAMKSALAGKVVTVLGAVDPGDLGITMPLEHLLTDGSTLYEPPSEASERETYFSALTQETLAYVRYYGYRNMMDMRLGDVSEVAGEALLYKQWGGGSLVDVTAREEGRDPSGLARISRATGVRVVMSSSADGAQEGPDGLAQEEAAGRITGEILEGVGATSVRAGLIGPVKFGGPASGRELGDLRAAGIAHRRTGAPLMLRPGPRDPSPLAGLAVLAEVGVDLSHVIISDVGRMSHSVTLKVMEAGCYALFSGFGQESPGAAVRHGAGGERQPLEPYSHPGDDAQIDQIAWLVSEGFAGRVLMSQSLNTRHRMFKHGGHGYFYVLGSIGPRMKAKGISEAVLNDILSENPSRALTFCEPVQL